MPHQAATDRDQFNGLGFDQPPTHLLSATRSITPPEATHSIKQHCCDSCFPHHSLCQMLAADDTCFICLSCVILVTWEYVIKISGVPGSFSSGEAISRCRSLTGRGARLSHMSKAAASRKSLPVLTIGVQQTAKHSIVRMSRPADVSHHRPKLRRSIALCIVVHALTLQLLRSSSHMECSTVDAAGSSSSSSA